MPLAESPKDTAFERPSATGGELAKERGGCLLGRSGYSLEPEDRPGLHASGNSEASAHTGQEPETLSLRCSRRKDRKTKLGRSGTEKQHALSVVVVEVTSLHTPMSMS